jgi:hypothetical protein
MAFASTRSQVASLLCVSEMPAVFGQNRFPRQNMPAFARSQNRQAKKRFASQAPKRNFLQS